MAEIPNRTLQRGLMMLELLSTHPDGLALCELTQKLELPRATAFNLAHTLINLGYASQHADTGKYRLGLKMFEIGAQAVHQVDVMEVIRSSMAEIHRKINETTHLGVISDMDTLYIDKLESTHSIRMSSYIGSRAPLHCTALGKAMLSTFSDDEIRRMYADKPLTAITPASISKLPQLLEQLQEIRAMGYAVEKEENNANVCCVGVPLRKSDGKALYALSVSAPLFRMGEREVKAYAHLLLEVQPRIERFLKAR